MKIREKKIDCNHYREVDIIPRTDAADKAVKGKRSKKKKVSSPKQNDLNDKNARRYLVELGNGNFGKKDYHVTCTYDEENYPKDIKMAENTITNYLKRISYRRKKLGIGPLKYILVTEYAYDAAGEVITRIHHHVIMNGGMDRNEIEDMWTDSRINWKKYKENPEYALSIKRKGYVNADRLQLNKNGIEALCKYVTKHPNGKKRWSSSRNLTRPTSRSNDHKYSKKKVEYFAKLPDQGREYFERIYKGYRITEINPVYYDETGWHIYLKMWKEEYEGG